MSNNLFYAIFYATAYGFHVFPIKYKGKEPLTPNGFKDASTDIEKITEWWSRYPNANIGIATGSISGLWVVDVDGEYPDSFPSLPSPTVKTAKGYHYYFYCPKIVSIKSRSKINGANIDIRADGGYIVAPPSIHPDGCRYEFYS